ncbi:hypothetical protein [Mesorhizobium xinjiangense]|uniref:hypothetical protein n=1 Tax=Mesorhizobium xinjiangense TaxID=2678685 RepID=UPI0018DD0A84|nr:hypothetical protein [Mesorhizobium xinjiangense]
MILLVPLLIVAGVCAALAQERPAGADQGYDPMRRILPHSPSAQKESPPGNPRLGGLPDAPGAEETFYLCSACHSIAMVRQQHLSDERWDDIWAWMVEEQGMPEQDEETRNTILGYLKTYFSGGGSGAVPPEP